MTGKKGPEDIDKNCTDPAYWERILKEDGLLGAEEEEAGLEGESGGIITSLMEGVDAEIRARLAAAGETQQFMGSPNSAQQLYAEIHKIVESFLRDPSNGPVQFAIRRSCTTADDTLVAYVSKGIQYHWNMRNIERFKREKLIRHIETRYHADVQVLEHNNYGQLS